MNFSEFEKKMGGNYSPKKSFDIYLQTKLSILESAVKTMLNMSDEKWEEVEDAAFSIIIKNLKNEINER